MKYPNYVSQYTQETSDISLYRKKNYKSKKKRHKRIPTKQLKAKQILYTL